MVYGLSFWTGFGFRHGAGSFEMNFRPQNTADGGNEEDTKVKREQKAELRSLMNEDFSNAGLVVVTHYTGLTVAEMSALRDAVRKEDAKFRVTKNRITRLALAGTQYEQLADLMVGPTAVSYSVDPIAAARAAFSPAITR